MWHLFAGVAPIDNPQVVVLVTLYNPTGEGGHQGGGVAAPVGGQIFSEVLPYLEVMQSNQEEVEQIEQVQTPNILGMTIVEAEKILRESNLEIVINNEQNDIDKENTIITNQTPLQGISVNKGSKIYVDY